MAAMEQEKMIRDLEDGNGHFPDLLGRFRSSGLSVTDLISCEWCQLQVLKRLINPIEQPQKIAMIIGTEMHKRYEEEIDSLTPKLERDEGSESMNNEDKWAEKLIKTYAQIRQLKESKEHIIRELYIFGMLDGIWIRGRVDQLEIDSLGSVRIVEIKTTRSASGPSEAQQEGARLQVLLYAQLLESFRLMDIPAWYNYLFTVQELRPMQPLSSQIRTYAEQAGLGSVFNLLKLVQCVMKGAQSLPPLGSIHEIHWVSQVHPNEEFSVAVLLDDAWVSSRLHAHIKFLKGKAAAHAAAQRNEEWKCKSCEHESTCAGKRLPM